MTSRHRVPSDRRCRQLRRRAAAFGREAPLLLVLLYLGPGQPAAAQQSQVADTVHNLSVSGPGPIRSLSETEICKFCHIPHTAIEPEPLWSHSLSRASSYDVPQIGLSEGAPRPAPQPDGSSRLCLSCHDGTVALGDVAGEAQVIPMAGPQRLSPGQRGFLGTDLSGSHPVSMVVPDSSASGPTASDMGLRPLAVIRADKDVRLDQAGKLQCTTCHDPHADRYYQAGIVPRFWVKPTVNEVCTTCHALR